MTKSSSDKNNRIKQVLTALIAVIILLILSIILHGVLSALDNNTKPSVDAWPALPAAIIPEPVNEAEPMPQIITPQEPAQSVPADEEPTQATPAPTPTASLPQYISLPDRFAYRQDDDRWRLDALGYSSDRMQDYGCTVTSVANAISNLSGQSMTPQELNDRLAPAGGYTSRSWLIWDKVEKVTNGDIAVEFYDTFDHASIGQCMGDGGYPVIKIRLASGIIHWVLIVAQTQNDYLIRDPLVGSQADKPIYLSTRTKGIQALRCINKTRR